MTTRLLQGVAVATVWIATAAAGCSTSNHDADGGGSGGSRAGGGGTSGHDGGHAGASNAGGGGGGSHASAGSGASRSGSGGGGAAGSGSGGSNGGGRGGSGGSNAGASGSTSNSGTPSYDDVSGWIDDYATAHPGASGDINDMTPAEIAADPDAQRLLSLCGEDQRPVIPKLAWEHGGADHAWINPSMSALVYCVYIPVVPSTDHWTYDAGMDHVTADVYLLYPDENPCKDEAGADKVAKCIGDMTNFEILVDTASLNDGMDAGLSLSEAATELVLVTEGSKVHLWTD